MEKESAMKTSIRNSIILMGLALAGCGSGATTGDAGSTGTAGKSLSAVVTVTALPDGAALYSSNCASCHGALTSSTKIGADSIRNQNAITGNIGGMGFLATLTATDIQAISNALAPLQVQAIASSLAVAATGTELYASNCAACHGAIATSTKIGADFSRNQNAINNNTGGMGYLSTLTVTDIQAITAVLTAP
jgi:mono/diheme cytochrome c family protein